MRLPGLVEKSLVLCAFLITFSVAVFYPGAALLAENKSASDPTTGSTPRVADNVSADVDFELPDSEGRLHRLRDLRGQWVLVNFWATWCTPCVTEIPVIQKFVNTHANTLSAIGVNFEEIDRATLAEAIEHLEIEYLVVQAGDAPIVPFEPLKGLPSTFLVSPEGRLVYRHTGELSEQDLAAAWQAAKVEYGER